jgi:hypothetical protein
VEFIGARRFLGFGLKVEAIGIQPGGPTGWNFCRYLREYRSSKQKASGNANHDYVTPAYGINAPVSVRRHWPKRRKAAL